MPIFLLTDIEKSTEKWEKHRNKMGEVLARHDALLKELVENFDGKIVKHTGDGIFAIFEQGAPLHCAIDIQKRFARENWGSIGELRLRIGLHAGDAEKRGSDYFGEAVNRTARVMEAAWGGQILITPDVIRTCTLPYDAELIDFGVHMLHDLGEPQPIYGLVHPDLELTEFPPIRSLSAHPHNLPSQPTLFVGREKQLDEILKRLDEASCRLINIVGQGGIGKTRLALQAAAKNIEKFRHGVYFIPLDALTIGSIQFLVFTIADALKFSFYSREDPKIQLINYLREKEMLMVMDNFEHLIAEAELLTEIFENAPKIKFLVTSRERLRLKGEWIVEIKGMDYPEKSTVSDFESYSAIQLFTQGAQRVQPNFTLVKDDRSAVIQICKLVDGNPLGIELAASWIRSLSCQEIAHEIEKELDFLTTTLQDVPERHQSLRAVFESSWDLLPVKEKKIFRALSVFPDGFQREAAEKVVNATLTELTTLADKSLVRRNVKGRYELLQILRQYAEDQLEKKPKEKVAICNNHCSYYADFITQRESLLKTEQQKKVFDEITAEIENIRAAWRWAIEQDREEELKKLLKVLHYFYDMRGWLQEAEQVFRMTAEMMKIRYGPDIAEKEKQLFYAKALALWGSIYRRLSMYERAQDILTESVEIFKKHDEDLEIAFVQNELGVIAYRFGDFNHAWETHENVLKIREKQGNKRGIAGTLNNMAVVAFAVGEYDKAKQLHERALQIRTDDNDRRGMATSMNNLGNVMKRMGDISQAEKLYQGSLAIRREIGDRIGIASCLNNLGILVELTGDYDEAKKLYEESLAIKCEIGDQRGIGNTYDNLGSIASRMGQFGQARKHYYKALMTLIKIKAMPLVLEVMEGVACLFINEGKNEDAFVNCAVILRHPAVTRDVKEKTLLLLEKLKALIPSERVEVLQRMVESKKIDDLLQETLEKVR